MRSTWLRWTVCGVAAGIGVQTCMAQEIGAEAKKTAGTIAKAKAPIVVDGKLDEADWLGAKTLPANYVYGGTPGVLSSEPRMNVRYLWDDACLHIGYEVFDTNLVAKANGKTKGPDGNQRPGCEIWDPENKPVDVVEFFVIMEDRNLFWELHHNAANQFNDLLVITGLPAWQKNMIAIATPPFGIYWARNEFLQDEKDRTFACAVALKPRKDGKPSTVNDSGDEDTGYTAELRLPWYGLGAPTAAQARDGNKPWKMGGREVTILAVFQNGDLKDRYHTSAPDVSAKKAFFHVQTDLFPRYSIATD